MDLNKLIEQKISERIDSMVDDAISEAVTAIGPKRSVAATRAIIEARNHAETEAPRARKRGRGRASVVYVVMPLRKGSKLAKATRKADMADLFPTARKTFEALANASKPLSALEIEKAAGLGKKTVESCVYFLRHKGLIKSQPVA